MGRRAAERGPHRLFARQAKCLAPTTTTLYYPSPLFTFWHPLKFLSFWVRESAVLGFKAHLHAIKDIKLSDPDGNSTVDETGQIPATHMKLELWSLWKNFEIECWVAANLWPLQTRDDLSNHDLLILFTFTIPTNCSPWQSSAHRQGIVRLSTGHSFNTNKSIADALETWKKP